MKNWRIWLILAGLVVVGIVGYLSPVFSEGTPPYEGTELTGEAPDFQLADQNGSAIKLSDFRGKVVVLTFMDSKCKDTCPLTGAHFRKAYGQFNQNEASQIVFLGVNVNVEANTVADVLETTRAWHLDEIPNWHFLTGSREDLEPVWKDYGAAAMPNPDGSITHTPGTFLIEPSGQKRWYISTPFSEQGNSELALPLNELLVKHIREILRDN
ncbi:MAG: SCO family protein [Anaerolineae bacterium]|nr:SCO family protein [Anaerolineae bacterium]MCI0609883.1 SCO family protein [Anaerolineae bacterium]